MGGSGVLLLYGIETDSQFVMDPYSRDSWLNEHFGRLVSSEESIRLLMVAGGDFDFVSWKIFIYLLITKLLDEQESLAFIFLSGTIDLVDSSSWEDPVMSTTNPPTSSVGCWNHSQARLLSPILD
ncbi:hypothetical protein V6N13_081403 [Hibiscus sabdariffa]